MRHISEHDVIPRHWRRTTWRDKHPTHKQRAVLVDNGHRVPPTRGEASDLIAKLGYGFREKLERL